MNVITEVNSLKLQTGEFKITVDSAKQFLSYTQKESVLQ